MWQGYLRILLFIIWNTVFTRDCTFELNYVTLRS